jgi:hypothetical protein
MFKWFLVKNKGGEKMALTPLVLLISSNEIDGHFNIKRKLLQQTKTNN